MANSSISKSLKAVSFTVRRVPDRRPGAAGWTAKKFINLFLATVMVLSGFNYPQSADSAVPVPPVCSLGPVSAVNSGFEAPVIGDGAWEVFPSGTSGLGWDVVWAGSFSGAPETANLEIHRSVNGWLPAEGSQYAELDTDWDGPSGAGGSEQASVGISQSLAVIPNATYKLSFKLSPRPGQDASQNKVRVQFGSLDETLSLDGSANTNTVWEAYQRTVANDSSNFQTLRFTDIGTPDSFGMFIDEVKLEVTECPAEKATVVAQKIVCDSEADLPNWSGGANISASTAQEFVTASKGSCRFEPGWQFQWGDNQLTLPGNTLGKTEASGWHDFDSATGPAGAPAQASITLSGLPGQLWFREVLQAGYVPFSYPSAENPSAPGSDISAEFWCNSDVVNYDNSEYINVSANQTYYCVAINAAVPPVTGDLTICKYNDLDKDGQKDESDTPLAWPFTVTHPDQSTTTAGSNSDTGCVTLSGLPVGSYTLAEADDNGADDNISWVKSSPSNGVQTVDLTASGATANFLNYARAEGPDLDPGSVAGQKFNDLNGNGAKDSGEPGLSGWTIFLDADDDGVLDDKEISTTTDASGHYLFSPVSGGTHVVRELMQKGWAQTLPKAGKYSVDIDGNEAAGKDFGNAETGSLHGFKWNDEDGNSERDCQVNFSSEVSLSDSVCEPRLPGWTIFLDADGDGLLDEGENSTTTSDSPEHLGWYWFENLLPGTYSVCEVPKKGWEQTYPEKCHSVTLPDTNPQAFRVSENAVVAPEYNFGNKENPEQLVCSGSGTYTLNADFDKGAAINVVHTPSDQLQLDETVEPFGFIWVSNSGEGTIVKINTETGAIMGEYRTSPDDTYGNPSRTTVDKDGSVWVGNRQAVSGGKAAITHVGLVENGQCEDRNGNGVIDTSTGLNDVKPWTNESGDRGVATAQDECIVHFTRIGGSDARHISVDSNNNIWVSGINTRIFEYVKGGKYTVPGSGTIIRTEGPAPEGSYGGYGGLIDKNNVIWSASNLLRWDTSKPLTGANGGGNWTGYNHSSYGLCIDSQGNVFNTEYGSMVYKHAPDGTLLASFSHGTSGAQGCVVDKNDDLWVAGSLSGSTVDHLKNDGTFVGSVNVGSGPTGVAVDNNGKIWVTNHYSRTVMRIDPAAGPLGADSATKVGAVDYTSVDLGGYLYNYSDMTGSTLSGKAGSGNWTVVHDGQVAGFPWKKITWNADVPSGAELSVSVSTSTDGSVFGAPQNITSGQSLAGLTERYLKIAVSFSRSESGSGPVLYDLTATRDCGQNDEPSGGGSTSSGGGGGYYYNPPQEGAILGTSTVSSISMPALPLPPEGEVKGAATELPRTGLPASPLSLAYLAGLAALWAFRRK